MSSNEKDECLFPTMIVKCENDHETYVIIPPWEASLIIPCKKCGKPLDTFKWGGMQAMNQDEE